MINRDDFGRMIAIFALSYTDPLFDTTYLQIDDKNAFRRSCRIAVQEIADAVYLPRVVAWDVDWNTLVSHFNSSYAGEATKADGEKLIWWLENGYNGIYTPDLVGNMWDSSLHWAKHHDEWTANLDKAIAERTRAMIWSVSKERRSEKHMEVIEMVRDHEDTDIDMAIKSKLHLDFYDDFADPLLIFTCMRGKFVLIEQVRAHLDDEQVIAALNRIPAAWYQAEGKNYKDHDFRRLIGTPVEAMIDA